MPRTARRLATALAALILLATGATACGASAQDYPTPDTWTVAYAGQTYCPYEYDLHEIDMYGYRGACTRVAFPSLSIVPAPNTLEFALMGYWTTYSGFYESGYWYDQYYAPIGARYHVTVISRTSYMSNVSTFSHTYSAQVKSNSAKARWSGGKTGNYSFPTSNRNAKNKPLTGGSNTGSSNYGTANSRDRSGPLTNSGTKTGSGSGSSGGKSGTGGGSRRR